MCGLTLYTCFALFAALLYTNVFVVKLIKFTIVGGVRGEPANFSGWTSVFPAIWWTLFYFLVNQ